MLIKGIGVSPGVAIGKALVKNISKLEIPKYTIKDANEELKRLHDARVLCKNKLQSLLTESKELLGEKEAEVFNAHVDIIEDEGFFGEVETFIEKEKINAEFAVDIVMAKIISELESIEDEYIKERIIDIEDVSVRLIKQLLGILENDINISDDLNGKYILVSNDLKPSETAQLDIKKICGFITETGGKTSHTAIFAKALRISAVVGVENLMAYIKNDDLLIIDGELGFIYINPEEEIINIYMKKKDSFDNEINELKKFIDIQACTKDNIKIEILANVGSSLEVNAAVENGCDGIGLFRTEFLYMNSKILPSENQQFEVYKEAAERMNGKPVIIRTLDIGGDKEAECFNIPKEDNPFLGYRAVRICLKEVDIFKTQLRAVLRASKYGNIRIMFPMIVCIEELEEAKKILDEVKEELRVKKIEFDENINVGIMIETPSAAIISDILAKKVDFFSIGTNDLIQYTIAVDRMNQKVSKLYSHFHPSILRFIKIIIDNANKEGIDIEMCGEAASDKTFMPILIGMGLEKFSMGAASILASKKIIQNVSKTQVEGIVGKILNMHTSDDIKKYIDKMVVR